jgi:GNAT superfamily N-acetyltransferase
VTSSTRPVWLAHWSRTLAAKDGGRFLLRLLRPEDVDLLTEYFLSLSDWTKNLYGPHPFDRQTAEKLCAEDEPLTLRLVTVQELAGKPRIASYFILFLKLRPGDAARYTDLSVEDTASLAPSVRDELQSSGLGSLIMPEVVEVARRSGMKRMILCGGVQARNARGYHFYEKWGFQKVREFPTQIMNYDMVKEL